MDNENPRPGLWAGIRDEIRARRAERASREALERDLGGCRTPAERSELDAILGRYDEDEVADIRRIIDRRRVA